jgi:hypothetical protein
MNTKLIGGKALPNGGFIWIVSHVVDNSPDFESKINGICQKLFEEVKHLPTLPSRFGPQHRLLVAFKDDQDGVMGFYDIAGDNLNQFLDVSVAAAT